MKSLLLALFLPIIAFTQRPTIPMWSTQYTFTTAKIEVQNNATGKYGAPFYKDATITITDDNVTIDIPDKFFMKFGAIHSTTYKQEGNSEYFSFVFIEGNKMAGVTFFYELHSKDPLQILITAYDNYIAKNPGKITMLLTEFK